MTFSEKYLKVKTRKFHPAVLIVWAALSAAAMMIPGIPTLGTGGVMSLTYPLAPISGILFGPFAGALATMVGSIVGTVIAPQSANLGIWTFTVQTGTALVAGYLSRGKWQVPVIIVIPFTIWIYSLPPMKIVWWYIWIPITAIILSIVSAKWASKLLKEDNVGKLTLGVYVVALASFLVGIGIGDPQGIIMYDLQADLYRLLTWLMPVERCIFSIFTTILAVPIITGLPKIKIFVGPKYDDIEEKEDDVDKSMKDKLK